MDQNDRPAPSVATTGEQSPSPATTGWGAFDTYPDPVQTTEVIESHAGEPIPTGSLEEPTSEQTLEILPYQQPHRRLQYLIIGIALAIGTTLVLVAQHHPAPTNQVNSIDKLYGSISLPLNQLPGTTDVPLSSLPSIVSVHGQLNVKSSLVLGPITQPASPLTGQLYYDKTTNRLSYYDGSQFQSILSSATPNALTPSLSAGQGINLTNGVLTNNGVLSFGGQTGNISIGSGLKLNGNTLNNNGALSITGGTNITVTNDGVGNYTISGVTGAGTGNISTAGGTTGRIPVFSGADTLSDSLLSQNGTTVNIDGDLLVSGQLFLGTPLAVSNGGTGTNNFVSGSILVGNGNSAVTTITGTTGQCLIEGTSGPSFQACPGGTGSSSPTLQDVYNNSGSSPSIQLNSTGKGIAIRDNTTPVGGNLLNITNSAGTTIYLGVSSTGATINGNLSATSLSGDGSGVSNLNATNVTSGTVNDGRLSTNVALHNGSNNFTSTLQHNGNNVCDASGNCVGNAGGAIGGNGTANTIALFNGSGYTIGNSILSQNVGATLLTIGGNTTTTGSITAGSFSGNGASVTNVNAIQLNGQASSYYTSASNLSSGTLSDLRLSTNVALLNGTDNFTSTLQHNGNNVCDTSGNCVGAAGQAIGGSGTANKIAMFTGTGYTIGNSLLSQDAGATTLTITGNTTTTGSITAGSFSGNGASLTSLNGSNIASGTVNDGRLSTNVALENGSNNFTGTLQHNGNNVCDTSGNCVGAAGQAIGGSGTANTIAMFNGSGYTIGNSILSQNVGATLLTIGGNTTTTGSITAGSFSGNGASVTNVNAAQLSGQAGSYYTNATNISSGTLADGRLSTNVALENGSNNFTGTLQHNGNNVCDASGNCVGSGAGGAVGGSGTVNTIAMFNGSGYTIGNSLLSQDAGATTVTIGGAVVATSFSGNGASLTSLNGSNIASGTVSDSRLTTNVALHNGSNNFTGTLQHNGNNVCDASGNCVGSGAGGAVGGSGTVNTIAMFNGSGYTIGNSILSQDAGATTLTITGNTTTTGSITAGSFSGNGANVTNVNATNVSSGTLADGRLSTNVPLLNGTDNFTGTLQHNGNNVCDTSGNCVGAAGQAIGGSGTANTIAMFNGSGYTIGNSILSQNVGATLLTIGGNTTTTGSITAGSFSGNGASLTSLNGSNIASGTVSDSRLTTNVALENGSNNFTSTLQHNGNNVCDASGNCVGVSGGAVGGSGTLNKIAMFTGSGYTIGNSLLSQDAGATTVTIGGAVVATSFSGNGASVTNVNAAQLGGQASSYYTNATNLSTGTISDSRLSTNIPLLNGTDNFTSTLQHNGNNVCDTSGNCVGAAGQAIGGSGTANTIAMFNGSGYTIGNSILSQNVGATLLTIGGNTTTTGSITAGSFSGDGTNVTNVNAAQLGGQASSYYTNATNLSTGTIGSARVSGSYTGITGTGALAAGSIASGFGAISTTNGITTTGAIQGGTVAATTSYSLNGTTGSTVTCTGGQILQNQVVKGGIVTGGTCTTGSGGVSTLGALDGGTANANAATISGSTLYLQSASATYAGVVNTTTQTFAGNKTFSGTLTVNNTSSLNGNVTVASGSSLGVGTIVGFTTYSTGSSFATKVDYTAATGPQSIATGDFNGDGKADIVVANKGSNTISVFINNGDGTFKPKVDYAVGSSPDGVAVGDFNGDSKLDIAVTNSGDNTVSVLLGNGDGTFQAQTTYNVGNLPYGILAVDMNGDGKTDLVVSNSFAGSISVLLGNGNGTFQAAITTTGLGGYPYPMAAGDFNGDGKTDIAVSDFYGSVYILLGNGNGTFQTPVAYGAGNYAYSVAAGDFNGDGKLDLVTANYSDNTVRVLMGNGDGTFQSSVPYTVGTNAYSVVTGDFNGDGKTDIAAVNNSSNTVSVLIGNGDGTFQAQTTYTVGTGPYALVAADFNGDGKTDIATVNQSAGTISVLMNGVSLQNVNAGLSVTTSSASAGGIVIQGSAGQAVDYLHIQNSAGTGLLVVDKSGHLGVGTTVPKYAIDVSGDINVTGVYRYNGTGGTTVTCSTGQYLQSQIVKGGIVTNGSCAAAAMTSSGHIVISGSATPTVAAGTAACTSPTVSVSGTDTSGLITVTTGTSCSSGKLVTLTFGTAFTATPNVTITPGTATAATLQGYVDSSTTSTAKFDLDTGTTSVASTTYKWYYHVIQ